MPSLRHDDILLRLIKDVNDIKANLRRVVANFPLYDIANENTPAQFTANQNDYVPGNYDVLLLSSSRNVVLSGIRNGVKGRRLQLFNIGNYAIILPNESADSQAANRFRFQSGYGAAIEPGTNLTVYYYSAIQRWVGGTDVFDAAGAWVKGTSPTGTWDAVTYSPDLDLFVAAGRGDGASVYVITSQDGINWTAQTSPALTGFNLGWKSIAWSSSLGLFVAVGDSLPRIMTSPDGVVWTAQTSAIATALYSVAWSPSLGLFVAVGGDSSTNSTANKIQTSIDGVNWVARTSAQTQVWGSVTWSPELNLFVAVGGLGGTSTYYAAKSSNGITWVGTTAPSGNRTTLVWSPELGIFVAAASGSSTLGMYSVDGTVWTQIASADIPRMNDAAWSPQLGMFVSVMDTTIAKSYYSTDGLVWLEGAYTPTGQWNAVCWAQERSIFVAVGASVIMTSPS